MTAQLEDKFDYLNNEYSVIRIENELLFEPSEYGFSPIALSSACWRGHSCKYSIESGSLILSRLSIGLDIIDPLVWRGIRAFGGGEFDYWTYEGVNLPINYSGGIIIGRSLLKEFYNIWGFYQPHCYQHIFELVFEKGKLVKTIVHDKYMNKAREIIRLSSQVYKKSIGYYDGTESVTIRLPNQMDIKSFTLVVKDSASEYISATTIEVFSKFRSKGYIELDKK